MLFARVTCQAGRRRPAWRLLPYSSAPPLPPLEGFPFQISHSEAVGRFERFCETRGVAPGLAISNLLRGRAPKSYISVRPVFVPLWCFDADVRTVRGRTIYKQRRTGFAQDAMCYAGYGFHRHLLQEVLRPLHGAAPFDSRWLSDTRVSTSGIFVDPWSVYRGTAWAVVRSQIRNTEIEGVYDTWGKSSPDRAQLQCQFVLHSARRLLVPMYAFRYDFFGSEFHVFVSGLAGAPEASGIDHGNMFKSLSEGLEELRAQVEGRLGAFRASLARAPVDQTVLNRVVMTVVAYGLQFTFQISRILLTRFPLFWPIALGGFVVFRKLYAPLRASQLSWEEWVETAREEEQNQRERGDTWTWSDEFAHKQGERARQQNQQYQQQQQQRQQRPSQQNHHRHSFDHMTPYQILGVRANASSDDIKAGFRREMLKYHPDQQAGKSDEEKAYSLARSQAITAAYRHLRGRS